MRKLLLTLLNKPKFEVDPVKATMDLLCLITIPLFFAFALKCLSDGLVMYSASLFGFSAAILSSHIVYKRFGWWDAHRNFVMSVYSLFYIYMLASGGEEGTGLLWCYAFPLVMLFLLGLKNGTIMLSVLFVASAVILFIPEQVGLTDLYSQNTKLRFSGSMGLVAFLAFFMERARLNADAARQKANEALVRLASTDELTGLLNRRGIQTRLQSELSRAAREGTELSVVLCDVDHFKAINDKYGHDTGDKALKLLARQLGNAVRISDSVGRWGGEEFLILLPNTSIEKTYLLIERIRMRIAATKTRCADQDMALSISCGLASTKFSKQLEGLLKAADMSLYEAKENGRNCTRPAMLNVA